VLNNEISDIRLAAASHPNANAEHLRRALKDDHSNVRIFVMSNPNFK
jgi:hypothetical protein